jgi:hypothetical protein
MSIEETRMEIDDEAAFNELCNTPDMQVEDKNANTLLIGNRRFAWSMALKYARGQVQDSESLPTDAIEANGSQFGVESTDSTDLSTGVEL